MNIPPPIPLPSLGHRFFDQFDQSCRGNAQGPRNPDENGDRRGPLPSFKQADVFAGEMNPGGQFLLGHARFQSGLP